MKTLITAFAFGILFGSPLFVQPANAAPPMDDARMKALQECNVRARRYIEHTWGRCRDLHVSGLHDGTRPAGIA
jgi:hypothetical protein